MIHLLKRRLICKASLPCMNLTKESRCHHTPQTSSPKKRNQPFFHFNQIIIKLTWPIPTCFFVYFFGSSEEAYFFLAATTAFLATSWMTPTATVCLMSRTAKGPRGGESLRASPQMALEGTSREMQASPFLSFLGLSSSSWP